MTAKEFVPAGFDPPTTSSATPATSPGVAGFTFTVLDPQHDVIGCVYLYPSPSDDWDVMVKSWVRADRSKLDGPLADAVARWLATDWPWERVDRGGR